MKKLAIFNPDNTNGEIFRTIKHSYNGCRANLVRKGSFGQSGVFVFMDIQENMETNKHETENIMTQELKVKNGCLVDQDGKRYRIRKLTPRECFRLQDVSESDIDKMLNAKIAKTNLYKLAGNSICISPMYHIFRKLFVEKENENQQLELF